MSILWRVLRDAPACDCLANGKDSKSVTAISLYVMLQDGSMYSVYSIHLRGGACDLLLVILYKFSEDLSPGLPNDAQGHQHPRKT